MPSFCCIPSCKRVKQINDTISFHKFPKKLEVFEKWVEFVKSCSSTKNEVKKITKFSSICSLHFEANCSFSGNGHALNMRRSLLKNAVPTIETPSFRQEQQQQQNQQINSNMPVQIIVEDEALNNNEHFCGLCRNHSTSVFLHELDDFNFSIMRKCLPFINFNLRIMQKICNECVSILQPFSNFIDRIIIAQNIINQEMSINQRINNDIKLEPFMLEDEQNVSMNTREISILNTRASTSQKKCEILEIVDIKPLNFMPFETNALTNEMAEQSDSAAPTTSYHRDEVQILSPKQLKVEINDDQDDDDGENELELIKNYVYISTVFMHDHNYVKEKSHHENSVKTEFDEDLHLHNRSFSPSLRSIIEAQEVVPLKFCCKKKFKSIREYLIHKIVKHRKKSSSKNYCVTCCKCFKSTKLSLQYHRRFFCKRKSLPKTHYKMVKEINQKPHSKTLYSCPVCSKVFKGPKNLYQHKITHSQSKYQCHICDKTFKMKHGLRQHISAQHEKKKLFKCSVCNHSYALKGDVRRCRHSDLKRKN